MSDDKPLPPGVNPLPDEPIVPRAEQGAGNPAAIAGQATPGPQRMGISQAFKLAEQHQAAARLDQAEAILRQIISAQPRNAPALHLLGVVAHQKGDTEAAVKLVGTAIAVNGRNPVFHANLGEMYRVLGRLDDAIASGKRALKLQPEYPGALSNLGIAYFDRKEYDRAENYQLRALALDPEFPAARNNLGSIYRERKDRAAAIREYERVVEHHPGYLEALNNLGAVLTEDDRAPEAERCLRRVLEIRPGYADAHCNLGLALMAQENHGEALKCFDRALKIRPDYVEACMGGARALQQLEQVPAAEQVARKAVELAPDRSEAHSVLAGIESELGYPDRALASYGKALELDGESTKALIGKGTLLMELGGLEEAEALFRRAIELDDDAVAARLSLVQVRKVQADDDNLKALEKEAARLAEMGKVKATALHFALGKAYDDTGQYEKAFPHFVAGGALKRAGINYDPDDTDRTVDRIIEFFDTAALERLRGGNPSDVPIFVLGMARSGTTLTEQIIASHPLAHGAGELPDLLNMAGNPRGRPRTERQTERYPNTLVGLDAGDIASLGARYVEGLVARAPDAIRITDKMPANFFCVGLIHLMLPNAKIVHVRRDPVDTCVSGFSRLFAKGQPHSYDLAELGRYYRAYARLMEHWRGLLPESAWREIQYEELVEDQESQARRLIEYCGLPWDDACLEFHKTDRSIRTASVTQVRQPIYRTSMQRWRNYERFLDPLFDALGDLAPAR